MLDHRMDLPPCHITVVANIGGLVPWYSDVVPGLVDGLSTTNG